MINVTVKTLDSQNHDYSVPDDISVKCFKEWISSSVNIPPDKQRLIYCGRVLQDDKKLSEYNVHEKVVHLVMRAPPQGSSRPGDGRGNSSSSSSSSRGPHPHHRGSRSSSSNADGHQVLFGSIVVPEDSFESLTTTQGSSSSRVRLQQAKTMLDYASAVIDTLDLNLSCNPPDNATASSDQAQGNSSPTNEEDAMEIDPSNSENKTRAKPPEKRPRMENMRDASEVSLSSEEMDSLYSEIDSLNSMEPTMLGGGQLVGSGMGPQMMGSMNPSLAGGLAQAASAAVASALSSLAGGTSPTSATSASASTTPTTTSSSSSSSSSSSTTSTRTSSGPFVIQSSSSRPMGMLFHSTGPMGFPTRPSGASRSPLFPGLASRSATPSRRSATPSRPPSRPPTSTSTSTPSSSSASGRTTTSTPAPTGGQRETSSPSSQPHGNVRGFTVRITNRNPSQRSSGPQLEHPRCSVMVEVLDLYQRVQERLRPYMNSFYQSMVDDRRYQESDNRQLQVDQWIVCRVSEAMHFISHAMHAISDIIVDLRRDPPRQLRARPIIIPQPALVQAQINVTASSSDPSRPPRNSSSSTSSTTTTTTASTTDASSGATTPNRTPSPVAVSTSSPMNSVPVAGQMLNVPPEFAAEHDGVVVMRLGPNGITIDSLSPDGSTNDDAANAPPELIQSIMSSITSQFGMNLDGNVGDNGQTSSPSSSPTTSPSTSGMRTGPTPVHNSQAGRNSGTNTTNSTQTRVTHRPHVHVTPLHVPGMGLSQFDPFLPCQSHHIRSRRRHNATVQHSGRAPANGESNSTEASSSQASNTSEASSQPPVSAASSTPPNAASVDIVQDMFTAIQDVVSEVSGSLSQRVDGSPTTRERHRATLQEFLQPFRGGDIFPPGDSHSLFTQLFITVAEILSLEDIIQLFFGDARRINNLYEPLQQFIRERVLSGSEASEETVNLAIDQIISDIQPEIAASAEDATVQEGIDYVNSVHNFIRRRLHDIINFVLNHRDRESFGTSFLTLFRRVIGEFMALSLHCFTDGERGLERFITRRVHAIMSGVNPSIQTWSANTTSMQLRSMMSQITITDDQIRHYVVTHDEGRRMEEERLQRLNRGGTPVVQNPPASQIPPQKETRGKKDKNRADDYSVEAMEIDETGVGCMEEVNTSERIDEAPPDSIIVGTQPWHSSVPQEWIPVITRDVERQSRGVPDTNLSDSYLRGMPLKRRKIATQSKPHGTVQQVMQDNLRCSLRTAGVNRTLVESVSGEVSGQLGDSFAGHVRSVLKDELKDNKDFKPDKFPKSEQKIRK